MKEEKLEERESEKMKNWKNEEVEKRKIGRMKKWKDEIVGDLMIVRKNINTTCTSVQVHLISVHLNSLQFSLVQISSY